MLVEEFQDGCLVHGHLWCVNGFFSYSESPCCRKSNHKVPSQADVWFGKRYWLKKSKMAV